MKGIDVAKWQGTIDWSKVAKSGIQFAILKATRQNNAIEEAFLRNYKGCLTYKIPVGAYRYVYAKTLAEAKAEANALVKVLKGKTLKCGVWLDMEDITIRKLGKAKLTSIINTEAKILKKAGFKVGIYCNKDWYFNVLDGAKLSKTYPFWIARYPSDDNGTMKEALSPRSYAKVWQYSSKGKVPGIKGNVDLDYSYSNLVKLMNTLTSSTTPKVKEEEKKTISYYPKYEGVSESIVTALQAVKVDSNFNYRKKIAKANGIKLYVGSPAQNIEMLELLKKGKLIKV